MKARGLDKRFDDGEDITSELDVRTSAGRIVNNGASTSTSLSE